jgi:hypothetical protein
VIEPINGKRYAEKGYRVHKGLDLCQVHFHPRSEKTRGKSWICQRDSEEVN